MRGDVKAMPGFVKSQECIVFAWFLRMLGPRPHVVELAHDCLVVFGLALKHFVHLR